MLLTLTVPLLVGHVFPLARGQETSATELPDQDEVCLDDNANFDQAQGIRCIDAARLQLCRNTPEQLRCVDNNDRLRQRVRTVSAHPPFENCTMAVDSGGCLASPGVARWCPKACGNCPTTPFRDAAVLEARRWCQHSCRLCPGEGRRDCQGEFGTWGRCAHCRRSRVYQVLAPASRGGVPCQFREGAVESEDCCGPETRWRFVAGSSLPSFWEVRKATFFYDGACQRGREAVASAEEGRGYRMGTGKGTPLDETHCLDCCTRDGIGPISSGSQPTPFGCESALLGTEANASWRSSCVPCAAREAWLGFRSSGDRVRIQCAELVLTDELGTDGTMLHQPSFVLLQSWSGNGWQTQARQVIAPGTISVRFRVERDIWPGLDIPTVRWLAVGAVVVLFFVVVLAALRFVPRPAPDGPSDEDSCQTDEYATDAECRQPLL